VPTAAVNPIYLKIPWSTRRWSNHKIYNIIKKATERNQNGLRPTHLTRIPMILIDARTTQITVRTSARYNIIIQCTRVPHSRRICIEATWGTKLCATDGIKKMATRRVRKELSYGASSTSRSDKTGRSAVIRSPQNNATKGFPTEGAQGAIAKPDCLIT